MSEDVRRMLKTCHVKNKQVERSLNISMQKYLYLPILLADVLKQDFKPGMYSIFEFN